MRNRSLSVLLLGLLASCGDETDISEFTYGGGQPGAALAEGGEIRHVRVNLLGMAAQTWLQVYQYTGPAVSANAPFAAIPANNPFGNCVDQRNPANSTWPFTPITGATYLDLPSVTVTGPGITGSLNVVKTAPANTVGNSTFRQHDFTYGGGAPGDAAYFTAGMTTAAMSAPGAKYTLDIGKGAPMEYYIPDTYSTPLNIGATMMVDIPAGQDLVLDWTAPANDYGDSGLEHNRKTYFNFTFFADPTAAFAPQFICFPDKDMNGHEIGHQVVPKAVIDALPAGGLIVHANLAHYMEAREAASGEQRRFDLVSIYCNISLFQKQ